MKAMNSKFSGRIDLENSANNKKKKKKKKKKEIKIIIMKLQ
jgi:hypothetical protein